MELGRIAHADAQREVETAFHGLTFFGLHRGVAETDELHQVVQTVVNGERRVLQDIRHIGAVKHIELTAHTDIAGGSLERTDIIGVDLSEYHALGLLSGVDQLEVVGLHGEIHRHAVEIAHVKRSVEHEGFLACGIEIVVVEDQTAVLDFHLTFVGAEVEAVDVGIDVRRIQVERTVEHRTVKRAVHLHVARSDSLESHVGAHHESIEHLHGEVMKFRVTLEIALFAVEIGAVASQHFLAVRTDEG